MDLREISFLESLKNKGIFHFSDENIVVRTFKV